MKAVFLASVLCCATVNAQPDAVQWADLNSQGIRLIQLGNDAAAEEKFRGALIQSEQFGEGDFRVWANLSNLALAVQEQGRFAESEKLYRRVLELREKYLPAESAEIAASLNNLATALHAAGRDAEADPLLRRGLLIAENAHDDLATAATLHTLGLVLMSQGQDARAEPVIRRAMALFEKAGGPDCFDAGKAANNLATLYSHLGEYFKAEEQERRAMPIYEKSLPPNHPLLGAVYNNMFAVLGGQKRFDEAEPYLRRALEVAERSAPDSVRTQQIRVNVATLEAARGHWQAAAAILEQVIPNEERMLGPNHPTLATALANYSEVLRHLNHKTEAKQAAQRAGAIMKSFRQ